LKEQDAQRNVGKKRERERKRERKLEKVKKKRKRERDLEKVKKKKTGSQIFLDRRRKNKKDQDTPTRQCAIYRAEP